MSATVDTSVEASKSEIVDDLNQLKLETKVKTSEMAEIDKSELGADGLDKSSKKNFKVNIKHIKSTIKAVDIDDEQAEKLGQLIQLIPKILIKIDNKDYDEIFGYRINVDDAEYVNVPIRNEILLKFLIANDYDVEVTQEKLVNTLNWRSKFHPLSAAFVETYDPELNDLGVLTKFDHGYDNLQVVTWNLYGNLKSLRKLFEKFGDSTNSKPGSQFLRWRIGLMEKSLVCIDFTDPKNHKIGQVHDYTNASLFRMDSGMKANTKEIVEIFGDNYPELLSVKYFIGIPLIMSWVFGFIKSIGLISKETLKKFQVYAGRDMSTNFGKENIPVEYGGTIKSLILDMKVKKTEPPIYGDIINKRFNDEQLNKIIDTVE